MKTLPIVLLRELLEYEPSTGKLFWRRRPIDMFNATPARSAVHSCENWNAKFAEKEAFTTQTSRGYRTGRLYKGNYLAHRVIWAIQTGAWPVDQIDHINNDRSDNRWSNLREATNTENQRNRRSAKGKSSSYLGVSRHVGNKPWVARIQVDGRSMFLGRFDDEVDAARAYDDAARKYCGAFIRPNFAE